MANPSLYEQVLARLGAGAELSATRPPRASASAVLWRQRRQGLEVYWIKRATSMPFMGGFHAFPGGGIARRDRQVEASRPWGLDEAPEDGAMPAAVTAGVGSLGPILCEGLVAGLFRELEEEIGLQLSAVTDVDRLVYAGRWLTPPLGPWRFDNRFFLLEWSESEEMQPRASSGEAEYGEWTRPDEALQRWRRGEVITAPPILHILRVLAESGPVDGLQRLWQPVEANLGPHRRIEFRPGVLLFPLRTPTLPPATHVNCYVLGEGESVLVDPGSADELEIERLAAALRALLAEPGRSLKAIWLTHHHPDHIGGVQALRQQFGLQVCAHAATAERLATAGIRVDSELVDNQRVTLASAAGFPVRILHTPGHARGHLCFLDESRGSLLAGDLVAGLGTIVIDPPEGHMGDYVDSLRRIRQLAPQALFPAHGPISAEPRTLLDNLIAHRLWREGRVLECWQAGIREPAELRAKVYDDLPPVAHPLAERQVLAHLEELRRRGCLEEA